MPEGVEILIQTNILREKYLGKILIAINYTKKFQKGGIKNREIAKMPFIIQNIWCRGKVIVFTLYNKGKYIYMTSQLGMDGQWRSNPGEYTNLWMTLGEPVGNGHYQPVEYIYYDDMRHYGIIEFHKALDNIWKRHGPCMMTTALKLYDKVPTFNVNNEIVTLERYTKEIRNKRFKNKRLAEFMMDQKRVSGIGNYLRAEILYQSKISPFRLLTDLSDKDIKTLYDNSLNVMFRSYKQKGKYYQGTRCGDGFQLLVYKKETDPNGFVVLKQKDKENRMCYYVPEVQV